MYLLDTNAMIAWMARSNKQLVMRASEARGAIFLSAIALHELYFGAFNSTQIARNLAQFDAIDLPALPFDAEDARAAGEIRAALRRAGTPISPYDTLIAGQALTRNLIVVTNNTDEFGRVAGLRLEDWTRG